MIPPPGENSQDALKITASLVTSPNDVDEEDPHV